MRHTTYPVEGFSITARLLLIYEIGKELKRRIQKAQHEARSQKNFSQGIEDRKEVRSLFHQDLPSPTV